MLQNTTAVLQLLLSPKKIVTRPRTRSNPAHEPHQVNARGVVGRRAAGDTVTPINHAIIVLGSPAARGQYSMLKLDASACCKSNRAYISCESINLVLGC